MSAPAMAYLPGADRMITGARLTPDGLLVRFADELEGVIPFERLKLRNQPEDVTVPNAHVVEVHLVDGTVEDVPWDFARHFADPGYRARSESVAQHDRRLFGKRLRTLRTRGNLTQRELAERAGVNRVTIARFEAGERLPRYSTMVALADGLGLPIERLIVP